MKKLILCSALLMCVLAMLAAPTAAAFLKIDEGIYRIDWKTIDDLLTIPSHPEMNVLVLEDNNVKGVSDAHMKLLRDWVESGGVLWVAGEGLESALAQKVARFQFKSFKYFKSSTDDRGGELVVRAVSPRLTIADHELTAGVNQLYLFTRSSIEVTDRADECPLCDPEDDADRARQNMGGGKGRPPVPGRGCLPAQNAGQSVGHEAIQAVRRSGGAESHGATHPIG